MLGLFQQSPNFPASQNRERSVCESGDCDGMITCFTGEPLESARDLEGWEDIEREI